MPPAPKADHSDNIIPRHGGFRKLRSFQVSEILYDATVIFCDRFVPRASRTHDQMVQAARSGCRNIAEGSEASATSKKSELKLTNVAKASLEELLLDCESFLRQKRLPQWSKDSPQAMAVRSLRLSERTGPSDAPGFLDPYGIATASAETAANTLICLCNQATYLLKRQIERLEQDFLEEGGITERMFRVRSEARGRQESAQADDAPPACPQCGKPMRRRTARQGPRAGLPFWGCSSFPDCRATVPIPAASD